MIPPDQEIYEVEKRIAERRQRVEAAFKATGRQTLRALSSPWALAAAALAGFLLAGGLRAVRRRDAHIQRRRTDKRAKTGTVSSIAMAAATWFIKSQFGSPVDMARFFIGKVKSRSVAKRMAIPPAVAAPPASGIPDRLRPTRRQATTVG
jgi:hypothetical protein